MFSTRASAHMETNASIHTLRIRGKFPKLMWNGQRGRNVIGHVPIHLPRVREQSRVVVALAGTVGRALALTRRDSRRRVLSPAHR